MIADALGVPLRFGAAFAAYYRSQFLNVTLPGGIGTLEEIVEMMTWAQLGRHDKPIILANISGFWSPMMKLLDHMKEEGFLHTAHKITPLVIDDAAEIVPALLRMQGERDISDEGNASVIERM